MALRNQTSINQTRDFFALANDNTQNITANTINANTVTATTGNFTTLNGRTFPCAVGYVNSGALGSNTINNGTAGLVVTQPFTDLPTGNIHMQATVDIVGITGSNAYGNFLFGLQMGSNATLWTTPVYQAATGGFSGLLTLSGITSNTNSTNNFNINMSNISGEDVVVLSQLQVCTFAQLQ